jgi:hypothetical protein
MNLWDVQPWVKSLVIAHPQLAAVDVLEDDGTYPKTPERERILSEKGLVLVIWEIESDGLADFARGGTLLHDLYVPVLVEENVKVNRTTSGRQMPALQALQYVLAAGSGRKPAPTSPFVLQPMDPPFKNFGKVNGVNRLVANFTLRHTIAAV